jgi:tight adherence protein B
VSQLLAAVCGAAIVGGVLMMLAGARRTEPPPRPLTPEVLARLLRAARGVPADPWSAWALWRWPTALAAGLAAWLVTGWPVAAPIAAVTVVGLPVLLSTGQVAGRSIDRIEAVEEWTRRLADVLVVGVGLEQAITATVRSCPDAIRTEVGAMAARLEARWPTEATVRAFADDLDDATGDLIAATLILATRRRGPGLARVLTAVADSVAEEVAMRRKVEAERAKPRTTARAVTLITLGVVAVGSLNGDYLRPYGTPLGQVVLAAIAVAFVACLAWMRALTLTPPGPRILGRSDSSHPVSEPTAGGAGS